MHGHEPVWKLAEGAEHLLKIAHHAYVEVVYILWVSAFLTVFKCAVVIGHKVQMHHVEARQRNPQACAADEHTYNLRQQSQYSSRHQ